MEDTPRHLPYGHHWIDESDIETVRAVMESELLTCGPRALEFEERFAERVGARYAVAVSSGTAALHLAMRVADVGAGDRVVTSPNTFLASANAAAFVGATPDFADIDEVDYNLDPAGLEAGWRSDTKAVVAVDYAGQSCDFPAIAEVARANGAVVVEDACHAVGGRFEHDGRTWSVGSHPWVDMATFSFHPVKTMTTGEGGMLVTNCRAFADRARMLRTHGVVKGPDKPLGLGAGETPTLNEFGPWYYEMRELGYNYRITDLQCALGLSQLNRLNAFIRRRREIVALYNEGLAGLDWLQRPGLRHSADRDLISWHLYTVAIDFDRLGKNRTAVMAELLAKRIGTQVLYIPVHLQPWYRETYGYGPGKCPVAERFYGRALSLPLFPRMEDADAQRMIEALRELAAP